MSSATTLTRSLLLSEHSYQSPKEWSPGGNAPTYFARFWTRYDVADPSTPPELLVVHMSYTGTINDASDNMIYLAPLKQAQVDSDGNMRLVWWRGNERLKGAPHPLPPRPRTTAHNSTADGSTIWLNNRNGSVLELVWLSNSTDGSGSCADGSLLIYPTVAPPSPSPAPHQCAPPALGDDSPSTAPHRYWRLSTSSALGNRWDICSLDFFSSHNGTGPSLVNRSHGIPLAHAGTAGGGQPQDVFGADPFLCNISNSSTWARRWGASPMPGWIGWDFSAGQSCAPYCRPVSVRSVVVRQYDTEYCAKTMEVQWSDDGECWHEAWSIDASQQCPYDATRDPAAGITISPPDVAPPPPPAPPPAPPPLPRIFEIGVDKAMRMQIYAREMGHSGELLPQRTLLESADRGIREGSAIHDGKRCHVRGLIRGSMVEVYVNDVLLLPVPLMNTITPGGFESSWAGGVRAPVVEVGLGGSWADKEVRRQAWTMDLPALFPMP